MVTPLSLAQHLARSTSPFASTSTFRFASSTALKKPRKREVGIKRAKSIDRIEGDGVEYDYEQFAFTSEDDQAASFPTWEELGPETDSSSSDILEVDPRWQEADSGNYSISETWEASKGTSRWGEVGEERTTKPKSVLELRPRLPPIPPNAVTTPIPSKRFRHLSSPLSPVIEPPHDFTSKKNTKFRRPNLPLPSSEYILQSPPPIEPFIPFGIPTRHPVQPHELPLLSRYDWRLSAPLHQIPRYSKPKFVDNSNVAAPRMPPVLDLPRPGIGRKDSQGHNKLIGVGLEPAHEGLRTGRFKNEERWGWKLAVEADQRSDWIALDNWRLGPDRLIDLCKISDERAHLGKLRKLGTPPQRVEKGYTLIGVNGTWTRATIKQGEKDRAAAAAVAASSTDKTSPTPVADHRRPASIGYLAMEDESQIGDELTKLGSKFSVGDILRLTIIDPTRDPNGPQPVQIPRVESDPPQCEILEIKDGKIKVSFEQVWSIEENIYQVDPGFNDTTGIIQRKALDNLAHDPINQILANAKQMEDNQKFAHETGKIKRIEEFALRGTSIRETIVIPLELQKENLAHDDLDMVDDSPRVELSRIPIPTVPTLNSDRTTASNPSSLFSDNQLINSWIKRYSRIGQPMIIEGDPVLGLNDSQTRAVAMSLGENFSLIQGPPGTGKSATIVAIIHLLKSHFRVPQPILFAAPTHIAVDNVLLNLLKRGLNPMRLGKNEKMGPNSLRWSVQERVLSHPMAESLSVLRSECDRVRIELLAAREQAESKQSPFAKTKADRAVVALDNNYRQLWAQLFACEKRLYSSLFASVDVFCVTAMGSGTNRLLNMIDFPIVFLDEAAMCTEPISLVPMMKGAQHVTLIGDHMQLPAIVSSQVARTERLHVSLFERLMDSQAVKTVLLDTQYRMRPCISAFPNFAFYQSALKDSPTTLQRPSPPLSKYYNKLPAAEGFEPTVFVAHSGLESTIENQSTVNRPEVEIVVDIVADLLHQNPALEASDIGIISPYAAQTALLRDTFLYYAAASLAELLGKERADQASQIEVNTVDGFQGREKSVIILSTVRSNRFGKIGFLTDKRRLNVSLTRAQDALFVVGNPQTLSMATVSEWSPADVDADASIWRRYIKWMQDRDLVKTL